MDEMGKIKTQACSAVEEAKTRLWKVSEYIHANPELGYEEFKATQLIADELKALGCTVEKPYAGMETSFRTTMKGKGPGPKIAILVEYDALPEVDQAVGHNIIAAASLGSAFGLKTVMDSLPGEVVFLGCPAEQGYALNAGGKVKLIRAGAFEGIDIALFIHPADKYRVWGKTSAREHFRVTFHGRRAPSSDAPYDIVNAIDAAVLMLNSFYIIKQGLRPHTVVHYVISKGGITPNVLPLMAEVKVYVRAASVDYLQEVVDRLHQAARNAAQTVGAKVEIAQHAYRYEDSLPNVVLSRVYHRNFLLLGVPVEEPIIAARRLQSGQLPYSTDLGNLSRIVPTQIMYLDSGYGGLFTTSDVAKAIAQSISPKAHEAVIVGAKALAMCAIDFLQSPSLVEECQKELADVRANGYMHRIPISPYPDYFSR